MDSPEYSSSIPGSPELEQIEPPNAWRPLVMPAVIVIIGLAIAWALFAHFGRSKPIATGTVLQQTAYPVSLDAPAPADGGTVATTPTQNETILLVRARVTNIGRRPLTIFDLASDIKLDGNNNQSSAAMPEDVDRLFERFPDLAAARTPLLTRHQVIQPGQSAEGLMVFNYAWTPQQWAQHKDGHVAVSFENGASLILPMQ